MSPQMKALNSILCLAVATHCWAEDNSIQKAAESSIRNTAVQIVITSENEQVSRLVNQALLDVLCGYPERAAQYFSEAATCDADCIMAHAGMLMVTPAGSDIYRKHLQELNRLLPETVLNPVEEWYLSTILQYVSGDLSGTAAAFKERAALYRRDTMAACWDIALNHLAGTDTTASLSARAEQLILAAPENGYAHFLRALLDEHSSTPSENALKHAQKAVELLSGNPIPQLLYGRLLANSGKPDEAINFFKSAGAAALSGSETSLTAQLCAVTARVQTSKREEWILALKDARTLAQQSQTTSPATDAEILGYWEGRTMLLRMLVLQDAAPASQAINMAAKTCNAPEGDILEHVQKCLVESIRARSLAETKRKSTATQCLAKAEKHMQQLQKAGADILHIPGMQRVCYQRAVRACMGALYRAKVALYESSADLWQEHLNDALSAPSARLLPPELPQSKAQ